MNQTKRILYLVLASQVYVLPSLATTHTIQVGQPLNQFSPQNLTINLGDTVIFTWASGSHTVVADNSEWTTFSMSSAGTHEVILTSAGDHGYHCGIHGGVHTGMWGNITVVDPSGVNPAEATDDIIIRQDGLGGALTIMNHSSDLNEVMIVSTDGRQLATHEVNRSEEMALDLATLPRGLYVILLKSPDGIRASRLITKF
jgi:plastocyanin